MYALAHTGFSGFVYAGAGLIALLVGGAARALAWWRSRP
jgi:hypothetical protein